MSDSDYKQQQYYIKFVYHSNHDNSNRRNRHNRHHNIDPHDYDTKIPGNKKLYFTQ